MGQKLACHARQSCMIKGPRRNRAAGRDAIAVTGQNANRDHLHYVVPVLPVMQLRQIVSAHQPNKLHAVIARQKMSQSLGGKACAKPRFNIGNLHPRMIDHIPRMRYPILQRGWPARLERIAGRNQPPHMIQTEPLQGLTRDMRMPLMAWIE